MCVCVRARMHACVLLRMYVLYVSILTIQNRVITSDPLHSDEIPINTPIIYMYKINVFIK
jgi:hypothetical protein